MKELLK